MGMRTQLDLHCGITGRFFESKMSPGAILTHWAKEGSEYNVTEHSDYGKTFEEPKVTENVP